MSAIEPAGEKIVRNLQQAIERLQDDIARVELWADALGCFNKPIPDYGHGQTRYDLPVDHTASADTEPEMTAHRRATSRLGSPRRKATPGPVETH